MNLPFNLRLLLAGSLLAPASACQKVVDLDLKSTSPRLVIEANLADDGHPCTVLLSQSVNYTESNTYPAQSGATVTLSDNAGHSETLPESSTRGRYVGQTLLGMAGRVYTLRVEYNGESYVATSTLPGPVVAFAGLHAEKADIGSGYNLVPEYQDPAGVKNYYLFRQYRNGHLNKSIFLQDDEFTDGKASSRALNVGPQDDSVKTVSGDSMRVEMQNLDAGAYAYFRTLNQILQSNPLLSTTPANPQTNFSGNVLGYFSAHSRRKRGLLVP